MGTRHDKLDLSVLVDHEIRQTSQFLCGPSRSKNIRLKEIHKKIHKIQA